MTRPIDPQTLKAIEDIRNLYEKDPHSSLSFAEIARRLPEHNHLFTSNGTIRRALTALVRESFLISKRCPAPSLFLCWEKRVRE